MAGTPVQVNFTTKKGKRVKFTAKASAVTTGDVAGFLEEKYHVMEIFYNLHSQRLADELATSLTASLQDLLSGAPPPLHPFTDSENNLQHWFNVFIDSKRMDGLGVKGVPTLAALNGVNHRMKDPYAKRPPRPSFRDTGTYEASFRAWLTS